MVLSALKPRSSKQKRVDPKKSSLRPDIQGLRAFAVIAVILDHLLGWPSGGFVGVDIFFVISGFLITGLLLREHDRTGRISFGGFYKRRAKRILPAALLVLVATVGTGFLIFNKGRAWNTFWDGIWAVFFGANWRQAAIGTDYFAAGGPVSPLQHYWSLAVEEQFYFVWPWLMLGMFAITARLYKGRANPRVVAGVAMSALTLGSLAWSIWETSTNPGVAYFSTTSRAWELGIGALLACSATLLPKTPSLLRPFLAWAGLAGMVASLFFVDPKVGFPGPSALLPVLSVAMVIAAGTGSSEHKFIAPLTNRASQYLGDISYSLYLWHFPIVIFLDSSIPGERGIFYHAGVGLAILVVSVFAYHLVEDPIRKSPWLTGERKWTQHVHVSDAYKLTALGALATLTAVVVGVSMLPKGASEQPYEAQPVTLNAQSTTAPAAGKAGPEVTALQNQIGRALAATSWPDNLSPSMDEAAGNHETLAGIAECGKNVTPSSTECVWGDASAPKTAMLVGDSVAVAWAPGLIPTYGSGDWKFVMRAQFGCPFAVKDAKNESADCAKHKDATANEIQQSKPDLLIIANNYPDSGDAQGWTRGVTSILSKATGSKQMVALSSPPHDKDIQNCYKPGSAPADCVSVVNDWYRKLTFEERAGFEAAGVKYVDTTPLFCSPQGACPAFAGEVPVKLDQVHVTLWYAQKVAPALTELIQASLQ